MKGLIYKKTASLMLSMSFQNKYILEVSEKDDYYLSLPNDFISTKAKNPLILEFESKEEAIQYAKKKHIKYEVINNYNKKIQKKKLNFNFTKNRKLYYY